MDRLRDSLVTLLCTLLTWCFRPFLKAVGLPPCPTILVLKPCCLGDLLLATAALAALRETFPEARIVLATGAWSRPAVEHNPDLTEILDCGDIGQGGGAGLWDYWRFTRKLRSQRFDVAVVLDRSPLITLLPFLAGVPVRAGMNSRGRGFSLTHPVPATAGRHEAQLYLDVVGALGCRPPSPALRFVPTPAEQAWAEEALRQGSGQALRQGSGQALRQGSGQARGEDGDWVAVHPGGGVNPGAALMGKRWAAERYAALVARFLERGSSVVLVGGAPDRPLVQSIHSAVERSLGGPPSERSRGCLLDLSGGTTFGQLGAVLRRCRLFVGNDTGPMHLAVAVGTPVVAIFGPSKPELYGPFSSQALVVYHGDRCSGCRFRGGLVAQCRHGYACMAAAAVDEVWEATQRALSRPSSVQSRELPS